MENPWSAYLSDGDPLALSTHCPNTISSTHMQMIKLFHSQHAGRNAKMSDYFPTTWSRTMSVCRGTRKSTCISISSLTALSTQHDRYLQRCTHVVVACKPESELDACYNNENRVQSQVWRLWAPHGSDDPATDHLVVMGEIRTQVQLDRTREKIPRR